jgi:hypothetical protein
MMLVIRSWSPPVMKKPVACSSRSSTSGSSPSTRSRGETPWYSAIAISVNTFRYSRSVSAGSSVAAAQTIERACR